MLDILKARKDLLISEVYLLSAVTALQHVIETLLHFISPYLQDTISQVCRTGTASRMNPENRFSIAFLNIQRSVFAFYAAFLLMLACYHAVKRQWNWFKKVSVLESIRPAFVIFFAQL